LEIITAMATPGTTTAITTSEITMEIASLPTTMKTIISRCTIGTIVG
jgi:hypothetical protein